MVPASRSERNRTDHKTPLSRFLVHNPFPDPLTLGFFYREKMRAIHRIAPDRSFADILEVGGGRSGLTALLYPEAQITNIDLDPEYRHAPCNEVSRVEFVCGDAADLPFDDASFDAVTMFDLLEHVPDDAEAVSEAVRVLRPGGFLLISSPNDSWRFPYYRFLRPICPSEEEMFDRWGHVRRGYSLEALKRLIPLALRGRFTFINPATVLGHDIAFSRLPARIRKSLCTILGPVTWLGYACHTARTMGTETASAWQKPSHVT